MFNKLFSKFKKIKNSNNIICLSAVIKYRHLTLNVEICKFKCSLVYKFVNLLKLTFNRVKDYYRLNETNMNQL